MLVARCPPGALVIGPILDSLPFHRRTRGYIGLAIVSCFVIASWGGGLSYQLTFTRDDPPSVISYKDGAYGKPAALVFFCELAPITYPCPYPFVCYFDDADAEVTVRSK